MFNHRILNSNELEFVRKQIANSSKNLIWVSGILIGLVAIALVLLYAVFGFFHVAANLVSLLLVILCYTVYAIGKGYKKHKVNPQVFRSNGTYSGEYRGGSRAHAYVYTLNGVGVKVPWHWRKYLKSLKDSIAYEYILRDGAVALNERTPKYLISINDTLSLDYELKHGLKKAKSLSFFQFTSLILFFPAMLILFLARDLDKALDYEQLFLNENDLITLNAAEELNTISEPSYIAIENAWVHQYKRLIDFYSVDYLISNAERNRIYNHKYADLNYQLLLPAEDIPIPDKKEVEKRIRSNPLLGKFENKGVIDALDKSIELQYNKELDNYKQRVKSTKIAEQAIAELQPKTFILQLSNNTFKASEESYSSIKESLENTFNVHGFFDPEKNSLVSFEKQRELKSAIRNSLIIFCVSIGIMLIAVYSMGKVIYNTQLKLRLVNDQLRNNVGPPKVEKNNHF